LIPTGPATGDINRSKDTNTRRPVAVAASHVEARTSKLEPMASSVNPSIEEVETRLAAFQSKLATYGRDMFGEDFVISALSGETGGGTSDAERGSRRAPAAATSGPSKKKRDSAKTVLQHFLEDREELVRLRVITKAATERTHERISAAEPRQAALIHARRV
jgi:hypothetical protein